MTRIDVLSKLNELISPSEPLLEDTIISACDDIDSLSLLNIFLELNKMGANCEISDFMKCETIGDIISLALKN